MEGKEFRKAVLGNNKKLISRLYQILLEWEIKDEMVKEVMIHWAIDIGHNIEISAWEKLWNKTFNISA